jgi:hypothetical protein
MKSASEARDESDTTLNKIQEEQTRCLISSIDGSINDAIRLGKYELCYGLYSDYYNRPKWSQADMLEVFHHFQELGYRIEWTKPVFWYRNKWITINW